MEIAKSINESELNEDYVVGTGILTRVGDFVEKAFSQQNLDWKKYVKTSSEFKRPMSTGNLCADISKLKSQLSIEPKVKIDELISIMIESDIKSIQL